MKLEAVGMLAFSMWASSAVARAQTPVPGQSDAAVCRIVAQKGLFDFDHLTTYHARAEAYRRWVLDHNISHSSDAASFFGSMKGFYEGLPVEGEESLHLSRERNWDHLFNEDLSWSDQEESYVDHVQGTIHDKTLDFLENCINVPSAHVVVIDKGLIDGRGVFAVEAIWNATQGGPPILSSFASAPGTSFHCNWTSELRPQRPLPTNHKATVLCSRPAKQPLVITVTLSSATPREGTTFDLPALSTTPVAGTKLLKHELWSVAQGHDRSGICFPPKKPCALLLDPGDDQTLAITRAVDSDLAGEAKKIIAAQFVVQASPSDINARVPNGYGVELFLNGRSVGTHSENYFGGWNSGMVSAGDEAWPTWVFNVPENVLSELRTAAPLVTFHFTGPAALAPNYWTAVRSVKVEVFALVPKTIPRN